MFKQIYIHESKSEDYERMFDQIDEIYQSLKNEFYKNGAYEVVEIDMNMAKMKTDMLIGALRNLKKIRTIK